MLSRSLACWFLGAERTRERFDMKTTHIIEAGFASVWLTYILNVKRVRVANLHFLQGVSVGKFGAFPSFNWRPAGTP